MLIEKYNELYKKVKALTDGISSANLTLESTGTRQDIEARIKILEESLEKIDDYLPKIEVFRKIAENHMESMNLLTIEAPPGYRVSLNRLRMWAMLIDPMSKDDAYAKKVYLTAKCDECFLEKKRKEFTERIASLKGDDEEALTVETEAQKVKIAEIEIQLSELVGSGEMANFARLVENENMAQFIDGKYSGVGYWYAESPTEFVNLSNRAEYIALGALSKPLGFPESQHNRLKELFGELYRKIGGRVLIPAEIPTNKEFAISITCTPTRTKSLDRGLQNAMLNIINKYPAGENKVYLIDAVRYNSSALGYLKQLEDTFAIERLPRNPEQMSALLERIVSSFADMDDMLDMFDSVIEYNENCEPAKRLPRATLIIYGWPNAFEGQDKEYMQRIMTNYERYGISFISVSFYSSDKENLSKKSLPEYAAHSATYINMAPKETTIYTGDETPQNFIWYFLKSEVPTSFIEGIRNIKLEKKSLGNMYAERCDISAIICDREYRAIELPFGVDGKDVVQNLQFENENFATYLVGASRSGKSTLIHTLIAGLIRNYHPDNLELWLADFKQVEFKLYIDNPPPHVKYVLLDESIELVYDLIDKLTEEMLYRQRELKRFNVQKVQELNLKTLDKPMPLIFVILDEFSIMSQSIAESQYYKLRLQNLLAKGAALGIRFLFASQSFQTGIAGLTQTAKNQIQQRIAMKAPRGEIVDTLELTPNLKTEQVTNWMDALPPRYALAKYREGDDAMPQVMRALVLFLPDDDRKVLIQDIVKSYKTSGKYTPKKDNTYVDKKPVFVDGNVFEAFDESKFINHVNVLKTERESDFTGEETFITFGSPRLMSNMKITALSPEARENILLLSAPTEQPCTASIISSVMKCFAAQQKNVQIWAYDKNRLFTAYKNDPWKSKEFANVQIREGMDEVCDAIYETKQKIRNRQHGNDLIVLIGMDRICSEFEFIEGTDGENSVVASTEDIMEKRIKELRSSGATVETVLDQLKVDTINELRRLHDEIESKAKAEGKSQNEIEALKEKEKARLYAESRKIAEKLKSEQPSEQIEKKQSESTIEKPIEHEPGEYNAMDDFHYIIKQGSRNGYHFMLCLNSYSDLKQLKMKLEMFRHRLAFKISEEDSREMFGNKNASSLPEHICQYYDTIERYSFRPYLHKGIVWEGWDVDDNGRAVDPSAAEVQ